ncbi:MAG TPA: hypothetical protein VIX18_12245, partial [Nitrospirota bacterium]
MKVFGRLLKIFFYCPRAALFVLYTSMKIEQLQNCIATPERAGFRTVWFAILFFGCVFVITACGPKRAPSSRPADATWQKQKASQRP